MRIIYSFLILTILFISCEKVQNPNSIENFPYKKYELNELGEITNTDLLVTDFEDSQNCKSCHEEHYEEWSKSMHAYSMKDPIFFSRWKKVQNTDHFPA